MELWFETAVQNDDQKKIARYNWCEPNEENTSHKPVKTPVITTNSCTPNKAMLRTTGKPQFRKLVKLNVVKNETWM